MEEILVGTDLYPSRSILTRRQQKVNFNDARSHPPAIRLRRTRTLRCFVDAFRGNAVSGLATVVSTSHNSPGQILASGPFEESRFPEMW